VFISITLKLKTNEPHVEETEDMIRTANYLSYKYSLVHFPNSHRNGKVDRVS